MSNDDFISNLAKTIKSREQAASENFQRVQHENKRKQEQAEVVFEDLKKWLQEATRQLYAEMGRNVISYQFDRYKKNEIKLVGEWSDKNYLDIVLKDKGIIAFISPMGEPRSGGFYPEMCGDDNVRFKDGNNFVVVKDMGEKLLSMLALIK